MDCCGKKEQKNQNNKKISNEDELKERKHGKSHFGMLFGCIGLILVVIIASYFFDFKSGYATWILLAVCIGMHFFMMKGHGH